MLSKVASNTIFFLVFAMTRPGIELQSPEHSNHEAKVLVDKHFRLKTHDFN